jgi:hypothetical protein
MRCLSATICRNWLLLAVIGVGAWARTAHLERVGVRTVDEGSYCFFGLAMLNGDKACIQDKPGQALILASGFALLGRSQYAAVAVTAMIGVLTIPALYWLGLLIRGKPAGIALAAGSALLPYFLHYNRSAASDSNCFFLCVLALCLFLAAVRQPERRTGAGDGEEAGRGDERTASLRSLLVSGLLWGIAATVNLAAIPPFAITWAFLGVFLWWRTIPVSKAAQAMAILLAGGVAGVALVEVPLAYFIDFGKVWGQFFGHAGHISASQLRWEWAWHLWTFVGPVTLVLALVGLVGLRQWWRCPNALFPLLLLVLAAFYARAALSLPRLHLPILLGLFPLAGLGAALVAEKARQRLPEFPESAIYSILALLLLCPQVSEARRIVSLSSGYPEACDWLAERMGEADKGIGTYTWWTFLSFTGRTFSFSSYVDAEGRERGVAEALNSEDWEPALLEELRFFRQEGYSYLILDYLLFTRLVKHWAAGGGTGPPPGIEHWRQLVAKHNPAGVGGVVIPNPAATDYETRAEDAHIPPLENEPLGQSIHVYRIAGLIDALSGNRPQDAISTGN